MVLRKKLNLSMAPIGWDAIGALFTLVGIVLALLAMLSSHATTRSLYFLKLTDNPPNDFQVTLGLFSYCVAQECRRDKSIMQLPYDERIVDLLNGTFPRLFQDEVVEEQQEEKGAPHDPHMMVAFIFCVVCGGVSCALGVYKILERHKLRGYQDMYFTRGFLAVGASLWSLLLVSLCSITYQQSARELMARFPHLQATIGPCMAIIGCAFMAFSMASSVLFMGCATFRSGEMDHYFVV